MRTCSMTGWNSPPWNPVVNGLPPGRRPYGPEAVPFTVVLKVKKNPENPVDPV